MDGSLGAGRNPADLLVSNRSLVIKLLMRHGSCSRSQLSVMTGLTQAAITKIVASLITLDIVEETGLNDVEKGRRSMMLRLKTDRFLIIGVWITTHSYSIGLFDIGGTQHHIRTSDFTHETTPQEILRRVGDEIKQMYSQYSGIVAAGIVTTAYMLAQLKDSVSIIESKGRQNQSCWYEYPIDIPLPVFVGHDTKAGVLAEWWFGEHNSQFLVYLRAGDKIGSGIILNGRLVQGASGYAGEVGHMSIDANGRACSCAEDSKGCVEQYCSSEAFMRDVRQQVRYHVHSSLFNRDKLEPDDVFQAANQGDDFAISMVQQVGFYFGVCIVNIFRMYNPDTIVISDVMTHGGDILMQAIHETVARRLHPAHCNRLTIRYSQLQEDSSLLGAVAIAVDKLLNDPRLLISG